jgi:hypothetical protein
MTKDQPSGWQTAAVAGFYYCLSGNIRHCSDASLSIGEYKARQNAQVFDHNSPQSIQSFIMSS